MRAACAHHLITAARQDLSSTTTPPNPTAFPHAADAFLWACFMDVATFKPGNVSLQSAGHDMQAQQFLDSARASAAGLFAESASVGARVHTAVRATRAVAGCNTNLGILLLCAPLAHAAQRAREGCEAALRAALEETLAALDLDDARAAFAAIAHASPGGLGEAGAQDVHAPPSVDLRAAMGLAAHRDRIAMQFADGYRDIWRALDDFRQPQRDPDLSRRIQRLYLSLLAQHHDSHIARKYGSETAADVSVSAAAVLARLDAGESGDDGSDQAELDAMLQAWDASLKAAGLNPGTTADLTVCVLFIAALLEPSLMRPASEAQGATPRWPGAC